MTPEHPGNLDSPGPSGPDEPRVLIVGPDGIHGAGTEDQGEADSRSVADLVEQPAKVMRIGSMIRQLLEEVKSAPLDEASRSRLREIHQRVDQGARTGARA